jgi:hypothetical protein
MPRSLRFARWRNNSDCCRLTNGALPRHDGPSWDRAPLDLMLWGKPTHPESMRDSTSPNLTWQVEAAALKDSSGADTH